MFSLNNGKAVKKNKFASQHFFGSNMAYLKNNNNRYQLKIAPKAVN